MAACDCPGNIASGGMGRNDGIPAIILGENCEEIEGFLFSSNQLTAYWKRLDEFEGDAYERVTAFCQAARQQHGASVRFMHSKTNNS